MTRPEVLQVVLTRFGCCSDEHAPALIGHPLRYGQATTPAGHQVRLVVFAATEEPVGQPGCRVITLGHVHRGHGAHGPAHGEAGHDHHAMMVEDFKKRFWVSLVLTLPILALSPMIQGFLGLETWPTGPRTG